MAKNETLRQLMTNAALNITALARAANVDNGTVRRALDGTPIRADKAQLICNALSKQLGKQVTIDDAAIQTIPL